MSKSNPHWLLLGALAAVAAASGPSQAQSSGLHDLPDELRATVKKELARKNWFTADAQDDDAGPAAPRQRKDKSCTMNIGSPESPGRGRRDVVVVATKPVVQLCK